MPPGDRLLCVLLIGGAGAANLSWRQVCRVTPRPGMTHTDHRELQRGREDGIVQRPELRHRPHLHTTGRRFGQAVDDGLHLDGDDWNRADR